MTVARKILSKTDLNKCAIVLTDELSRLLHQRGVFPSMGGNHDLLVNAVRVHFVNTGEELLVSYYASVRRGSNRAIEERFWSAAFAEEAHEGDELSLEFKGSKLVLEIRPPP